jgi:glucosamine-6-phosphate deaminase
VNTRVFESAHEVALAAADLVALEAAARSELVLAFPTGRTPIPMFDELAARHARKALRLDRATTFQLDELMLPPDDPRSFRSFLRTHAWSRLGVADERCHFPDTQAADPEAECSRYEEVVAQAGGLDLCVLGLGTDGHVAYNLPRPPRLDTHVVELPDAVAEENRVPQPERPLRAITMGVATLGRARKILLLATGSSKAQPIGMLATRFEDPDWPCTFLARHADLTLLLDPAAASRL